MLELLLDGQGDTVSQLHVPLEWCFWGNQVCIMARVCVTSRITGLTPVNKKPCINMLLYTFLYARQKVHGGHGVCCCCLQCGWLWCLLARAKHHVQCTQFWWIIVSKIVIIVLIASFTRCFFYLMNIFWWMPMLDWYESLLWVLNLHILIDSNL